MKQAAFEILVQWLVTALPRVTNEGRLLAWARQLLDGSAAVLVRIAEPDAHPEVVSVLPIELADAVLQNLDGLRAWYKNEPLRPRVDGLSTVEVFDLGTGRRFRHALVAFSADSGSPAAPAHELIVLGPEEARSEDERPREAALAYSSYHCWAAATLLRAYEGAAAQRELARRQRRDTIAIAQALSLDVLPQETWGTFAERTREATKQWQREDQELFYRVRAVEWTSYGARVGRGAEQEHVSGDEQARVRRRDTAREWLKAGEREWYRDRSSAPPDFSDLRTAGDWLIDVLISNDRVDAEDIRRVAEHALKDTWEYPGEKTGPCVTQRFAMLLLEGQLRLARTALLDRRPHETRAVLDHVCSLLDLAAALACWVLTPDGDGADSGGSGGPPGGPPTPPPPENAPTEVNREVLRFYLVERLAAAKKLRRRYLRTKDPNPDRVDAPPEARRRFAKSLLRYLTWVTNLLEARLSLKPVLGAVSAAEVLDSQLHLVDRLVHVEYGVDERLGVRALLGGGVEAEAQLYLLGTGYRDHLLHVIDVFLLGDLLLRTELTWLSSERRRLVDHLQELMPPADSAFGKLGSEEAWLRGWSIASLLHDIGYQYLWLRRIAPESDDLAPWAQFFSLPGAPVNDDLVPKRGQEPDPFLEQLADALPAPTNDGDGMQWLHELGKPDNRSPSRLRDHGLVSALRVAQLAAHFDGLQQCSGDSDPLSLLVQLRAPLCAIAYHNLSARRVHISRSPLDCLLKLCDELQEWGRKRINAERTLRDLYLAITDLPGASQESLKRSECLRTAYCNIEFSSTVIRDRRRLQMRIRPLSAGQSERARVAFYLCYREQAEGAYDPVLTLLSKAYNLQHVDLALEDQEGLKDLHWCIELRFPRPEEYGPRTEYDFYGAFAEEARVLPLLHTLGSLRDATEPGMIRIRDNESDAYQEDRFGIVLRRRAEVHHRHGWLRADPRDHFKAYLAFKERLLRGREPGVLE